VNRAVLIGMGKRLAERIVGEGFLIAGSLARIAGTAVRMRDAEN